MITVDVYCERRLRDCAYVVKAWDTKDSMYPVLYNQQYLGYTLKEVKQKVRERLTEIYKDKVTLRWHRTN